MNRCLIVFLSLISSFLLSGQPESILSIANSYGDHTTMKQSSEFQLEWISLGPTLNSARVEAVQADPNRPGTFYVAFGSGGLWKTTNNGMSWRSLFDDMPVLGIGDIALAPSNPDIIYVGTGESLKKPRNFTMPGNGIYRSNDGGETWTHLGLDDTWHIGEIAVHPENPDIVVVAALGHFWSTNSSRGLYRTEDGGQTWQHVLYVNDNTGANDIVFSPANPDVLYATVWENNPTVHGSNSGVYVSRDAGQSWNRSVDGIHIDDNTGRIGIAASYQDVEKAYIFIDQRNREDRVGAGEMYKTTDGGISWEMTHEQDIKSLSVIGWYFMDVYLNPENDDEVYALGVRLLHSEDGGQNFDYIEGVVHHLTPSPAQTLHLDHCEMWINPNNPGELLLGNDGGIFHSYDKGKSWFHLNNIPTGEFYDIELDGKQPYTIYGGTQDNSTVMGPSKERKPELNDTWEYLWIDAWSGGDGCITLVDPNDDNILYFSMQNGGARRMDLEADTSVSIRPRFPKEDSIHLKYNFITPYMLSRHHRDRLYMGGNYLLRSDDRGDNWQTISPDFIVQKGLSLEETAAGAIAESPFSDNTLYVGTDRGSFWVSHDGGTSWADHSNGLPPHYIRTITPSEFAEGRIIIQLTGLNYDDFGAYAFMTEDHGKTWESITGNLPDQPVNTIIEDPWHQNTLYAGTYRGVYITRDRGASWSYLGRGMPDVSIGDLAIDKASRDLVVATHGRGIYKLNLTPFFQDSGQDELQLFAPGSAVRPSFRDTHGDVEVSSVEKVAFTWSMPEAGLARLEILNAADSLIWSKDVFGTRGLNQLRWDLVTKEEESMSPYFLHYKQYLSAGHYTLRLSSGEAVLEQPFEVVEN